MQAGRVPDQCDILVAWSAGNILVSRPADESGLKPSLATTIAKASERVIADPLGWGDAKEGRDGLFPALREKRLKAEFGYDDRKGVGACGCGPSGLFRKFVAPAVTASNQGLRWSLLASRHPWTVSYPSHRKKFNLAKRLVVTTTTVCAVFVRRFFRFAQKLIN